MNFEIIGVGFDGSTDATDDRILWVSAPSATDLMAAIHHVPYKDVCELTLTKVPAEDVDFELPRQARELQARLWKFSE